MWEWASVTANDLGILSDSEHRRLQVQHESDGFQVLVLYLPIYVLWNVNEIVGFGLKRSAAEDDRADWVDF